MIALLVYSCLAAQDTQCDWSMVYPNFVHEKQCTEVGPMILPTWAAVHPDRKIARATCSDKPQFLLNLGKA